MQYDNNTTRIRRLLLVRLAQLAFENKLVENIDRIPIEVRPKGSPHDRCCVHKERAVIKYRLMASLGFKVEDEADELMTLGQYAQLALSREKVTQSDLTVIDEACSACVRTNYFVTNACRGCFARPCAVNCPKKCISFVEGQARIDSEKCVNCGKCMKVCPYHAVVYVPIPCEEECPVGAISKGEDGVEIIDEAKCILCGKCMAACPFGAIMSLSQIVDIIKNLLSPRKTVALIAPALAGQFDASLEQVVGALKQLGFDHVVEVALGADIVARRESIELAERLGEGDPFMATSCCPAYIYAVQKHVPELRPFVSKTCTPMHCAAEIAAQQYPDALRVFISPCAAKIKEAVDDPLVDYTLTFEELGSLLVAKGIDVADAEPQPADLPAHASGRGFPVSGGVAEAIKDMTDDESVLHDEIKPELIDGISKQSLKTMKNYALHGGDFNVLEVMCCEGGCVAGPCVIGNPKTATKRVQQLRSESKIKIPDKICPGERDLNG
ncbi:MAG: monomeric [FeFe] hydrogenase [Armatimonadota bacterium]